MTHPKLINLAKTLTITAITAIALCSYADRKPLANRVAVFTPGEYGSKFYRIPAIATANDGTLIAVADKRIESISDLPGRIDIVSRISHDNGLSWEEYVTVAQNDSIGGYGDPGIVVDRHSGDIIVTCTHGNGTFQSSPGHITVIRSHDNGKTWCEPVDISDQILTTDPNGLQPIKCVSAFATSGASLQLRDGRLMFVLVTRQEGIEGFKCYAIYSDDRGYNWQVSSNPATCNGDESKVVELADGTLMMSIRNRYQGPRRFSYSHDRGATWSEPIENEALRDPACNGDIIRYDRDGYDLVIQSLPGSPTQRVDVTLYASDDQGQTWSHNRVVAPYASAYSSMTILPDGTIGCLIEEGVFGPTGDFEGYNIAFTAVDVRDIMSGEK
jgi:sialidase-1